MNNKNNTINSFGENFLSNSLPRPRFINEENKNKYVTQILVVESKDRDKGHYPNPNDYIYELIEPYKNVVEVELMSVYISGSDYEINKKNNLLDLKIYNSNQVDSKDIQLIVPHGNYTQEDLTNFTNENSNMDEKITCVFSQWELYYGSKNIKTKFNYNESKYYIWSYYKPANIPNTTGPTDSYGIPVRMDFSFGGKKTIYKTFTVKELDRTQSPPINVSKRVVIDYDDYRDNTIGKYLGYKADTYSNFIEIQKSNYNSTTKNLQLVLNSIEDFYKIYNIIILKDTDLSIFLVNPSDITKCAVLDFGAKQGIKSLIKILNANIETLTIELNTYQLKYNDEAPVPNEIFTNIYIPVISDYVYSLEYDKYVLLQIPELNRYDSRNSEIQNSFIKIPLSNSYQIFDASKAFGSVKKLEPPTQTINKLTINFKKHDGDLYNFNGRDHVLVFAITYLYNTYS